MKKNDLLNTKDSIFRILSVENEKVFAIDCQKKTMPKFYDIDYFKYSKYLEYLPFNTLEIDDLTPAERKVVQERFTMIAPALSVVEDDLKRSQMIEESTRHFGVSKQTLSRVCKRLLHNHSFGRKNLLKK